MQKTVKKIKIKNTKKINVKNRKNDNIIINNKN